MGKTNSSSIIIVVILLVVVNGLFLAFTQSVDMSVVAICILFCNLAIAAQLLPVFTTKRSDEKYQKGAASMSAGVYLVIQIVVALCILSNDNASPTSSFIIQGAILGLFLLFYFRVIQTSQVSNSNIAQQKNNRSVYLQQATQQLRLTLSQTGNRSERAILQQALAKISSTPSSTTQNSDKIDKDILDKCSSLCENINNEQLSAFCNLIVIRKNMSISSNN